MVCSNVNYSNLLLIKVMPNQQDNCQLVNHHQDIPSSPSISSSSPIIITNHHSTNHIDCINSNCNKRVHFENDQAIISIPLNNQSSCSCNHSSSSSSSPGYCPGNHHYPFPYHQHHHPTNQQHQQQQPSSSSSSSSHHLTSLLSTSFNGQQQLTDNDQGDVNDEIDKVNSKGRGHCGNSGQGGFGKGKDEDEEGGETGEDEEEEILIDDIDSACFIQLDPSLLVSNLNCDNNGNENVNESNVNHNLFNCNEQGIIKMHQLITSSTSSSPSQSTTTKTKVATMIKPETNTIQSTINSSEITKSLDNHCSYKHIIINPLDVCYHHHHQFDDNDHNDEHDNINGDDNHHHQLYYQQQFHHLDTNHVNLLPYFNQTDGSHNHNHNNHHHHHRHHPLEQHSHGNNHFPPCQHHHLNEQHLHHHNHNHHQTQQLNSTNETETDDQPSSSPGSFTLLPENSFDHPLPIQDNNKLTTAITAPLPPTPSSKVDTLLQQSTNHITIESENVPSTIECFNQCCDCCFVKLLDPNISIEGNSNSVKASNLLTTSSSPQCLSHHHHHHLQQHTEIITSSSPSSVLTTTKPTTTLSSSSSSRQPCTLCLSSSLTLPHPGKHYNNNNNNNQYHNRQHNHCNQLSSIIPLSTSSTLPSIKQRPNIRLNKSSISNHEYHQNPHQHARCDHSQCSSVKVKSSSVHMNSKLDPPYQHEILPDEIRKKYPPENSDLNNNDNGVTYLPIIIVSTVLTVSTVLLVIASIFFIKYLPFQKSSFYHEGSHCSCAFGGRCSPDSYSDNIASICRCDNFQCDSTPIEPICANDNKTYNNLCQLNLTSCNLQLPLTVQYKGTCDNDDSNILTNNVGNNSNNSNCDLIKCDNGTICVQESPESPGSCSCPTCSHHYEPVCASDGLFYTNECVLRRESCKEGIQLKIVHSKECGGCDNVHCQFYSNCDINETGQVLCQCPVNCTQDDDPVCGSDGNNYSNECSLRLTSCQKRQYLTVTSKGHCDLCSNVHCKYGAHCEIGFCVCPKDCPSFYEPVCSTDGYTYTNECQMRLTACQRKVDLSVNFFGECQDSQMIMNFGSTSFGYIDTCDQNTCRFGGVCDYDATGIPHCICSYSCPMKDENRENYVCGSDGRLYENECKLQEEACRRQQEIGIESRDKCYGQSILTMCDGSSPLVNPSTGLDYYCGDESGSKSCPVFSYCQRDGSYAKCCQDVAFKVHCNTTTYGCCADGLTPALGLNQAGCPEICNCNKLGSNSLTCDPNSNQCQCKTGVGGIQCDRCKPGFWGLHKISEGNNGCIPCSCNKSGSVRGDCEQMTGRCVCKQGLQGIKCDICPEDAVLLGQGCTHVNLTKLFTESCETITCSYGSICEPINESKGSRCVCTNVTCSPEEKSSGKICSTDGTIFPNECQLKLYSCQMQKTLTIAHKGPCKGSTLIDGNVNTNNHVTIDETITQGPLRRSTVFKVSLIVPTTTIGDTFKSIRQTINLNNLTSSSSELLAGGKSFTSSTPIPINLNSANSIILIPGFLGNSFIELPRLQAYTRLSIEMDFITYTDSAILLYNGQTVSGEGDFISLTIRKGYIEFRYDLGSGMVIIRSKETISIGSVVHLVAKRFMKDGILSIDGQSDVTGSSPGSLSSLDLAENLYLGWIKTNRTNIYNNIGLKTGLIGCLYSFSIDKTVNLPNILEKSSSSSSSSNSIIRTVNIIDCLEMPCSGSTIQRYTKDTTSPPTTTTTTTTYLSSSSSLANYYPCHNGGTCLPLISPIDGSLSSSCKCKPGYTGNHCQLVSGDNFCSKENNPCIKDTICASLPENQGYSCFCTSDDNSLNLCLNAQRKTENAFIPDFSSTSYLTLPTLTNIAQTFIIEIWFYSRDPDGLLFYNGQQSINSRGDFISLNLVNRFVQFSYNLGSINPHESGLVTLKSDNKISIGKWHSIRITRNRKQGSLQLDSLAMVYGEAKTNLSELNLDQPFYIGSIPPINSLTTHRELNLTKGFNGAIQRIVVNGDVWDDLLDRSIEIYNIAKYSGPPCESPNPCSSSSSSSSSSNSICVPQFNDYFCKCNHFGDYNENSCDSNEK